MNKVKAYVRIMRLDHWIKQLFILPGVVAAMALAGVGVDEIVVERVVCAFFATSLVASANYVINEWLDAQFDRYHPTKKYRSVVENDLKPQIVYCMYAALSIGGLALASVLGVWFLGMAAWLWVMGVLYNVRPIRTKDVPVVDVLSESLNNAIRLLLGWFVITTSWFPPVSLVFGYWMAGAFLMATKRFAEYRMIGDPAVAAKYRKSFKYYSEVGLLISAVFYALCSVFSLGIFLVKYRMSMLLLMPFFMGLFCYYLRLAFKPDSSVQKPEKLYHERGLMLYVLFLIVLFTVLMFADIPALGIFADSNLIPIR